MTNPEQIRYVRAIFAHANALERYRQAPRQNDDTERSELFATQRELRVAAEERAAS